MIKYKKKNFSLRRVNIYFFQKKNVIIFKNVLGYLKMYMPNIFFLKKIKNRTSFIFLKKNHYNDFLNNFFLFINNFFRFYFFRLRLRGLGYRIKKITKKLFRFFFAFNHYFYFHVSNEVFFKHRKRNLIVFSNNLMKLNDIFSHLLLLKKLDFYERSNTFIVSKKILFFKKRK